MNNNLKQGVCGQCDQEFPKEKWLSGNKLPAHKKPGTNIACGGSLKSTHFYAGK